MADIKMFNDDGSEYVPKHQRKGDGIPFAPGTPALILVALSDSPKAMPLKDIPKMLADYANKFPNMIQPNPEVTVGLCVWDDDKQGWRPLTQGDLKGGVQT